MRFLNNRIIYAGFIINILIVVLVALAAFKHFQNNNETLQVTRHRMEFAKELQKLSSLISHQENEVKGYIITKDEKYISRLNKLNFETAKCLTQLHLLQFFDQNHLKKLTVLENSITERSELNNHLIQSFKYNSSANYDSIIKYAEKNFLNNRSDKLIEELSKSVEIYLNSLSARNESNKSAYRFVFVVSLTVCALLLMVVLFILRYYLKIKIDSEKRLEEALKQLQLSEEEISMLLENIGDGVIGTDKNQIITYMNSVAADLTGWNKSEARGERIEKIFNIVNSDSRERVENPLAKAIDEKKIITLDRGTTLIRKDKSELMIDDSASPIINKNDEVTGAVLIFRDVTEEKLAEKEIEESKKRFEQILNFTPVAISISEQKDGRFVFINEVFCRMLGYTHSEVIGRTSLGLKILDPEDRELLVKQFAESGGHAKDMEVTLRRKDGTLIYALYSAERIEISGEPCLATAIVDLTDKRRSELRVTTVLENIGEGVLVANHEQQILLSNHIAEEILQIEDSYYSPDWTNRYDIFYPDGRTFPAQYLPLERALRGEEVQDVEIVLRDRETKKTRLLRVSGKPIIGEDGSLVAAVVTLKDITKLRATEKALKESEMKYRKLIGFGRGK